MSPNNSTACDSIHLAIILVIIIVTGAFGGYLNYLNDFDTSDNDSKNHQSLVKYILLGIGAALLVPAFLKMISSGLANSNDNNDYLIFAGFCLIAAIFSRRFITTIGEKILEAAKKAEKISQEANEKVEKTQMELSSAKSRIEDVKLAVDINSIDDRPLQDNLLEQQKLVIDLADSYVQKTSIKDRSERLGLKAELGRKMGEIIVRNNLSKDELLEENQSEGMLLAIAFAMQLKPDKNSLELLNKIAKSASQKYTKYSMLVAYDTLARNSLIDKDEVIEIYKIANGFRAKADPSLLWKIDETTHILQLINPEVN